MSLRCDDTLVQMYVEGALAPGERAVVGDHLRTCVACQRRAVAYKALFWDLAHPEPEAEPATPPGRAARAETVCARVGPAAGRTAPRLGQMARLGLGLGRRLLGRGQVRRR